MPRPRSETTLDDRGRARRTRDRRAAELQALRLAVLEAEPLVLSRHWHWNHKETLKRARQAVEQPEN